MSARSKTRRLTLVIPLLMVASCAAGARTREPLLVRTFGLSIRFTEANAMNPAGGAALLIPILYLLILPAGLIYLGIRLRRSQQRAAQQSDAIARLERRVARLEVGGADTGEAR